MLRIDFPRATLQCGPLLTYAPAPHRGSEPVKWITIKKKMLARKMMMMKLLVAKAKSESESESGKRKMAAQKERRQKGDWGLSGMHA